MLLADFCIEFKDNHFQARTERKFHSLYELNLGNNKKAADNNACGFLVELSCNFSPYSTINFFVTLPSMMV